MKRLLFVGLAFSLLVVGPARSALAIPVTFDFRTSSLVDNIGTNNEPSIAPVLAQLQAMGLTLTTVGGLGFNIGCGTPPCLGADENQVDDFDGHISGVFAVPSSILGIREVNDRSLVRLFDISNNLIGSYTQSFDYSGTPVSHFDVALELDGMWEISWDQNQAVPDPGSSLLLLGISLAGLSAWQRRLG